MRIHIDNASKSFGAATALDHVSLEVGDGELFFLLGPSGCGKTTLLRAVAGFQELDAGCIRFDERDVTGVPPHQRNTGMMFQGYALWPHLTVAENVVFGLEMRGLGKAEREAKVRQALERVRIADLAERKPHQLSGGQQQRVALARTLVVEPACLLLDEPLANLDAKLRLEMRVEIRRLCKESGLTGLYVTHDQKEALSVADRLGIMHRGRLLQVGTPREVYTQPRDAFVAEFIGETNLVPGTVAESAGGNRPRIRTAGGLLCPARPVAAGAGQSVRLSLRPEALRIVRDGNGESENALAGTVRDTVYLGGMAQYTVRLTGDLDVQVLELNPPELVAAGAAVRLTIASADVIVLPG